MKDKGELNAKSLLDFSILKIINKIVRIGKDIKSIYESWDVDKNGWRK